MSAGLRASLSGVVRYSHSRAKTPLSPDRSRARRLARRERLPGDGPRRQQLLRLGRAHLHDEPDLGRPLLPRFGAFFIAGLPLIFSWVATAIGWPEGRGEDYQGSALAPSMFLGTTGGVLLGAPFFPFGLPWWDPDRTDDEAPKKAEEPAKNVEGR